MPRRAPACEPAPSIGALLLSADRVPSSVPVLGAGPRRVSARALAPAARRWAAGLVLVCCACGYTLGAGNALERFVPGRQVRLEGVADATFDSGAGLVASRELARAAAARSVVAAGGAAAGGVPALGGTLEALSFTLVSFTEWRVDARLRVLLRAPDGRVLAQAVTGGAEAYLKGDDVEATEVSRRMATTRLLRRLSAEALDRLAPP